MSQDEQPGPRIEVWEQAAGAWRWRYVEDGAEERFELVSNTVEPTEDAAVAAAALAYPGVTVRVSEETGGETLQHDAHRWLWAGATATLSLALAAAALRYRRWWFALVAPLVARGVVARLRRSLP
jgi:hypothetical protein